MYFNKISIITLTYKNWRILSKAIKSVASQLIEDKYQVEYLVVDDGTDDFDVEWVTSLLDNSGVNYRLIINENNLGTVQSFNNAIDLSNGEIIIPLSADDEFYDEYVVGDIIKEFTKTGSYIISGLRVPVLNNKMLKPCPDNNKINLFYHPNKLLKYLLINENIISGASTYYHREVFNIVGPFDKSYRLLEDYPFYIKALSQGINISLYQRKVIKYGTLGISAKGGGNSILKQDFSKLYEKILARPELTFLEKRRIVFFKVMSGREKWMNSWRYPEQFISLVYRNIFLTISNCFSCYKRLN
ncbi:glycosyltransferase [Aeromonas popoffii]|uniref:glycosyltransferase n=1 Tax=Aeromonas popoffii TaxID=70856 RepID=UPI0030D22A3C